MKTKAGKSKAYLALIHTLPCCVSGMSGVSAHHIRYHTGLGVKSPDYWCIPLAHTFHQGSEGIHEIGTRQWEAKYGSQLEHAKKTQALLSGLIDIPEEYKL